MDPVEYTIVLNVYSILQLYFTLGLNILKDTGAYKEEKGRGEKREWKGRKERGRKGKGKENNGI